MCKHSVLAVLVLYSKKFTRAMQQASPLSAVNWIQKNRALNELHTKASIQKLESAVGLGKRAIEKQC
jgi:hypothetical protein